MAGLLDNIWLRLDGKDIPSSQAELRPLINIIKTRQDYDIWARTGEIPPSPLASVI